MIKHLKGLDTLRALAALIVVWGHLEILKKQNISETMFDRNFYPPNGHIAVVLFFVISGFLITYLLVKEREKSDTISFKKFYMRRILRIWPLYYFIILLSYLLFQVDYSGKTIALCLSIFPNVAHALGMGWSTSPQIWSIGVEEQFYLFWPLLFMLIPKKRLPLFLIIFFIGYSLLPHIIGFINVRTYQNEEVGIIINKFFFGTKFNCMAIGALLGFLYANKSKYLDYISNKYIAYSSIFLAVALWFTGFELKYFTDEFYSILFTIALYNIVVNPKINIDNSISSFLGRISYGIYMYHWIIILLFFQYIPKMENVLVYNLVLYVFVFGGTILVSWVSFSTFEKYFLNIKKKFETKIIVHGTSSKETVTLD